MMTTGMMTAMTTITLTMIDMMTDMTMTGTTMIGSMTMTGELGKYHLRKKCELRMQKQVERAHKGIYLLVAMNSITTL